MSLIQASILGQEAVVIPVVSICALVLMYLNGNAIISFVDRKTLGQRQEIIRLLRLNFSDTTDKQVTYLLLSMTLGLGLLFFFILLPNVWLGLIVALTCIMTGGNLVYQFVKSKYEKRCSQFVDQLIDGLTIMANGITSGLTPPVAMERVVDTMGNPLSQEFQLVLSQVQIGRSLEEALEELGQRIPRAEVQMFVSSVNVLKETGGNLGETLQTIVFTIRERQKVEKKIEAMTTQSITQGIILTMVPFVLIAVFLLLDPNFISPMFSTTLGLVLIFCMILLQVIGGLLIRRIVTIKV